LVSYFDNKIHQSNHASKHAGHV
jgi:hypothetical protein